MKNLLLNILSICGILFFGTVVFDRLIPTKKILENVEIIDSQFSRRQVELHIVGNKTRECRPIQDSSSGYYRAIPEGTWKEAKFFFKDDDSPGSSKPIGKSDFGWWVWNDVDPSVDEVIMTIRHICPEGEITSTIGPFSIK